MRWGSVRDIRNDHNPMAFLSVNNGSVKVMPADYDTTFDRAVEILPESQ